MGTRHITPGSRSERRETFAGGKTTSLTADAVFLEVSTVCEKERGRVVMTIWGGDLHQNT